MAYKYYRSDVSLLGRWREDFARAIMLAIIPKIALEMIANINNPSSFSTTANSYEQN